MSLKFLKSTHTVTLKVFIKSKSVLMVGTMLLTTDVGCHLFLRAVQEVVICLTHHDVQPLGPSAPERPLVSRLTFLAFGNIAFRRGISNLWEKNYCNLS